MAIRNRTEKKAYGITRFSGPFASVFTCPKCKHVEKYRTGVAGVGRGHGLREGGGCYSRMVAHIRKEHPEVTKDYDRVE